MSSTPSSAAATNTTPASNSKTPKSFDLKVPMTAAATGESSNKSPTQDAQTATQQPTLLGKISFRPSQYSTLVQYGFSIESSILTDFSGSNFSYSFRINQNELLSQQKQSPSKANGDAPNSDTTTSNETSTLATKAPLKSLKIKLWKLELKTIRKSVQFQKKLLIKLKVTKDEWERNPVSEWKVSAGDIKLEISEHHQSSKSPESPEKDSAKSPADVAEQILKAGRRKSSLGRSSVNSSRFTYGGAGNLFNSIQQYQQQRQQLLEGNNTESANTSDQTATGGSKLQRVEMSAQTLIVAIQKRPNYKSATRKHRLSTTNITKNLFADSTNSLGTVKDDLTNRRRSLSTPAQNENTNSRKLTSPSTSPTQTSPQKIQSPRLRRGMGLKIIASNNDNYSDTEECTPQTPVSPSTSVRSSVESLDSFPSSSGHSSRNSDSIPKWAQRALSPASTPSTMRKQRFVDRSDPDSYAYIMYFIQGSQDACFSSFSAFCKSILYVGAGSPSHHPFSVHFSTHEDGSQYSLTERLFRMEQHNSRVHKAHEKYRLFLLQLPTFDYANEQWVMAHLRQASILQALTSPVEGYWKKPIKHLNSFKTCPTNDNTSIVMNEHVVEFNKVLRYERIQFGLNLLKIAFVRAQSESIELDLDVKWIERDRKRNSGINENVRIVDSRRYKLYFTKADEQVLNHAEV